MSNIEFNRLQSAVIQQNLRAVGIALDVRTYEFATLFADVAGRQLPDVLRCSGPAAPSPTPTSCAGCSTRIRRRPSASTAAASAIPASIGLLDEATISTDDAQRRVLYNRAQRLIAEQAPYISLWCKTNVIVAQRDLRGIRPLPTVDFAFLKDVER